MSRVHYAVFTELCYNYKYMNHHDNANPEIDERVFELVRLERVNTEISQLDTAKRKLAEAMSEKFIAEKTLAFLRNLSKDTHLIYKDKENTGGNYEDNTKDSVVATAANGDKNCVDKEGVRLGDVAYRDAQAGGSDSLSTDFNCENSVDKDDVASLEKTILNPAFVDIRDSDKRVRVTDDMVIAILAANDSESGLLLKEITRLVSDTYQIARLSENAVNRRLLALIKQHHVVQVNAPARRNRLYRIVIQSSSQ